MSMPRQGADLNSGVYRTPLWFLRLVNDRWPLGFDFAADIDNCVVNRLRSSNVEGFRTMFFDKEMDSLNWGWGDKWVPNGNLGIGGSSGRIDFGWLNPPFDPMRPWVKKAAESGCPVVMLFPNSPGSGWWHDYVDGHCLQIDLIGRLRFEGEKWVYPKDLSLAVYGSGVIGRGRWDLRGLEGYKNDALEARELKKADREENRTVLMGMGE